MAELYAVRDRDGKLKAYCHEHIVKNKGKGYWMPEYNARQQEIPLNESEFEEILWDDTKPTKLMLVNPLADVDNEQLSRIPNTIGVTIEGSSSQYNNTNSTKCTVFINNISYIESTAQGNFKTIIHMKGGDKILCVETPNKIHRMISEANENS